MTTGHPRARLTNLARLVPAPSGVAEWGSRAACRGVDPEVFFDVERAREALSYCAGCPVALQCAAAGRGEPYGVWGGRRHGLRRRPVI